MARRPRQIHVQYPQLKTAFLAHTNAWYIQYKCVLEPFVGRCSRMSFLDQKSRSTPRTHSFWMNSCRILAGLQMALRPRQIYVKYPQVQSAFLAHTNAWYLNYKCVLARFVGRCRWTSFLDPKSRSTPKTWPFWMNKRNHFGCISVGFQRVYKWRCGPAKSPSNILQWKVRF